MADDQQESQEEVKAEKSQKNPLVALLLIINAIALSAVAFMQYQYFQNESKKPDLATLLQEGRTAQMNGEESEFKPTESISKESLVDLQTFTVNLAQGDGPRRYVRLNAVLKMSEDSELTEVEARKPQIRDTVISILNSKRPEDVLKRDGKVYLKEQIKSAINSFLVDGKVVDIFYVNFQVN